MTPKKRRLAEREQPKDKSDDDGIPTMSMLDSDFDSLDEAATEFAHWRWPGRDDG
jgi:hypothetical protein